MWLTVRRKAPSAVGRIEQPLGDVETDRPVGDPRRLGQLLERVALVGGRAAAGVSLRPPGRTFAMRSLARSDPVLPKPARSSLISTVPKSITTVRYVALGVHGASEKEPRPRDGATSRSQFASRETVVRVGYDRGVGDQKHANPVSLKDVAVDVQTSLGAVAPVTPTGMKTLDNLMAGGLRSGDLFAITGDSGSARRRSRFCSVTSQRARAPRRSSRACRSPRARSSRASPLAALHREHPESRTTYGQIWSGQAWRAPRRASRCARGRHRRRQGRQPAPCPSRAPVRDHPGAPAIRVVLVASPRARRARRRRYRVLCRQQPRIDAGSDRARRAGRLRAPGNRVRWMRGHHNRSEARRRPRLPGRDDSRPRCGGPPTARSPRSTSACWRWGPATSIS